MAGWWTNKGKADQASVAVPAADLRALLVNAVPANAAAAADLNFVADVVADELVAENYGRKALTGESVLEIDASDLAAIDANDPAVWAALGAVPDNDIIEGLWVYRHVTNDADSVLWVILTPPTPIPTNGGDVTLAFHANGISTIA